MTAAIVGGVAGAAFAAGAAGLAAAAAGLVTAVAGLVAEEAGLAAGAAGLADVVAGLAAGAAGLAAEGVAGLAVAVAGLTGVWALAATVLAANNKIKAVCFMALSNSGWFLTEVYQVPRQLCISPAILPARRFWGLNALSRWIDGYVYGHASLQRAPKSVVAGISYAPIHLRSCRCAGFSTRSIAATATTSSAA